MTVNKYIESFVESLSPEIELYDRGMTIRGLPAVLKEDKRFANRQVNWVRVSDVYHNPTLRIVLVPPRR